jgi:hypothetical protein
MHVYVVGLFRVGVSWSCFMSISVVLWSRELARSLFFGATEVLYARKHVLGHYTETHSGTMMIVCSGVARCQVFRVESVLLWTGVGDVFQDIFVSRYFWVEV